MKKTIFLFGTLFLLCVLNVIPSFAQEWKMKKAPLMTKWSQSIDVNKVFPEYPRPQMERENNYLNLNGIWDFAKETGNNLHLASTALFSTYKADQTYDQKILVPFPIESAISGIMDSDGTRNVDGVVFPTYGDQKKMYKYRRTFTLPSEMQGKKVLLHFGAVDWRAKVFINGKSVGSHEGGYDPFYFDITSSLNDDGVGSQEVVVHIYDPTDGGQPRGKQVPQPDGIWYTPSSGIWQTVWIEAVNDTYIRDFTIVPDIDQRQVKIKVVAQGGKTESIVEAYVYDGDKEVAKKTFKLNTETAITIPNQKLWSPDDPFLYDLKFVLKNGDTTVDEVNSYFGMRKISKGMLRGKPYMFLNNKPIFMYGPLDQGWWPDGLYTAPSDEALLFDLEKTKELGFNMTRKHIKIEPARWYYHCDRLGLMVWQDMVNPTDENYHDRLLGGTTWMQNNFYRECEKWIGFLKNHPSIVVWVPYNENWGQWWNSGIGHTQAGVDLIKKNDPTRLINAVSGWCNYEVDGGDIIDKHLYTQPGLWPNPFNQRVQVCGETGGWGYAVSNHVWLKPQNPYGNISNATAFTDKLVTVNDDAFGLTAEGLGGLVYTEIADQENEVNGFYTYDRVAKLTPSLTTRFKEGVEKLKTKALYTLVSTSAQNANNIWKYTTSAPAAGWNKDDFDDSKWATGAGGFGAGGPPGAVIRTAWDTPNLYLRRKMYIADITDAQLTNLMFSVYYDEDFKIYINGILAASATGYSSSYKSFSISKNARNTIKRGEENLIAVEVIQKTGGQYFDLGLALMVNFDEEVNVGKTVFTEIATAEDFNKIRDNLSGAYKLVNDIDLSSIANFQPIGTEAAPFSGYLYGRGNTVSGLKVNNAQQNYQGLFGYTNNAQITDVNLKDIEVNGADWVGGICGRSVGTLIERVGMTNVTVKGANKVGGMIGEVSEGVGTIIRNAYVANGDIKTSNTEVGGLVGEAIDLFIENAYFSGKVVAPTSASSNNAGGILGVSHGFTNMQPRVILKGVACMATQVTGGTANEFAARTGRYSGQDKAEGVIIYLRDNFTSNSMLLSNFVGDKGHGRAPSERKISLANFKKQSVYEGMSWDFNYVWTMPTDGYPTLKVYTLDVDTPSAEQSQGKLLETYKEADKLTISVSSPAAVWIYNMAGALLKHFNIVDKEQVTLASGSYVIKAVSDELSESKKIIL